jgi:hypothetical protein
MRAPHALAAFAIAGGAAAAPAPGGAAEGPRPAERILADYAAAIGGEKAVARHKTLHARSEITVKGLGLKGTEERHATASGKLLIVMNVPGIGTFRHGSTGRIRWAEDPIHGLRVLKGAEDEHARLESTWGADVRLARLYRRVRTVDPPAEVEKDKVECVELEPRLGKPAVMCFDRTTHLRVLHKGTQPTPQGDVPFLARFSDWRDAGGVKVPFVQEATAGPLAFEVRLTHFEFGVKVPDSHFRMPTPSGKPAAAP